MSRESVTHLMMNVPGGAASVTLDSGRLDRYMTRPAATKGPYGTGRVIAGVFVLIFSCLIVLVVAGSVLAIGQDPSPTMQVLRIGLPLSLWWLVVWAIAKVMFSMSLAAFSRGVRACAGASSAARSRLPE